MADEAPIAPAESSGNAPSAAPATEVAPAPVAEAPALVEPVAPEPEAKSVEVTPAAEAPKAEAAKESASLLSEAAPAPEAKPEGEKPEDGKVEAPATEEARADAPLPTYEPFTVPEGVELEDPQVDRFLDTIGTFERDINPTGDPKVHTAVQGLIQNLADQYTEEAQQIGERVREANAATFARAQEYWKDQFFNDPEIGGNRKDTTLKNCSQVISRFGGNAAQIAELKSALSMTGAGNHPAMIRFVNNIATFLGEGEPRVATKPEPQQQSRQERRYGNRK